MSNLSHIPTPETEAVNAQGVGYAVRFYAMKAHARDLERRLTVAREALESITRRGPIMGSCGDYREGQLDMLNVVSMTAHKALTLTAPNP